MSLRRRGAWGASSSRARWAMPSMPSTLGTSSSGESVWLYWWTTCAHFRLGSTFLAAMRCRGSQRGVLSLGLNHGRQRPGLARQSEVFVKWVQGL